MNWRLTRRIEDLFYPSFLQHLQETINGLHGESGIQVCP